MPQVPPLMPHSLGQRAGSVTVGEVYFVSSGNCKPPLCLASDPCPLQGTVPLDTVLCPASHDASLLAPVDVTLCTDALLVSLIPRLLLGTKPESV